MNRIDFRVTENKENIAIDDPFDTSFAQNILPGSIIVRANPVLSTNNSGKFLKMNDCRNRLIFLTNSVVEICPLKWNFK